MILGGGSNCQQCGCGGTCAACTRTCQNPHTGAAFQEVYRGYSFGAVNGLASDGYLTFSGDEDNPAFIPGGGPFHQAIGGSFYLSSAQTRFPCSLSVSFWRTLFPTDATTDTALSSNTVTFTCVTGQFFLPTVGVTLNSGDTYTFSNAVPLVPLFSSDPHTSAGSFGGFATCDNTQIGVQARIDWTSSERVHVLHGIVRECYEEGTPCATACGGSPPPNTIYLTIKNVSLSDGVSVAGFAGTYVLHRTTQLCDAWEYISPHTCSVGYFNGINDVVYAGSYAINGAAGFNRQATKSGQTYCSAVTFYWYNETSVQVCGTGLIKTGSSGTVAVINLFFSATGTFDWEISA